MDRMSYRMHFFRPILVFINNIHTTIEIIFAVQFIFCAILVTTSKDQHTGSLNTVITFIAYLPVPNPVHP